MKTNMSSTIIIVIIAIILGLVGLWCFTNASNAQKKERTSEIIQKTDAEIRKQAVEIAIERYNSTHSGWRWFTRNTWGRAEYNEILAEVILELAPEQAEAAEKGFHEKYGNAIIFWCIVLVIVIMIIIVFIANSRSSKSNRVPIPTAQTTAPAPVAIAPKQPDNTNVMQFDVDYESILKKHSARLGISPETLLAEHNGDVREAAQDAMQRT